MRTLFLSTLLVVFMSSCVKEEQNALNGYTDSTGTIVSPNTYNSFRVSTITILALPPDPPSYCYYVLKDVNGLTYHTSYDADISPLPATIGLYDNQQGDVFSALSSQAEVHVYSSYDTYIDKLTFIPNDHLGVSSIQLSGTQGVTARLNLTWY